MLNNTIKQNFTMSSLGTESQMKSKYISISVLNMQNTRTPVITIITKTLIIIMKYKQAVVKILNISKQLSPIREKTEDAKYTIQKNIIGKPLAIIDFF